MKGCIFLVAFLFASLVAVAVAGDNGEEAEADMTETSHAGPAPDQEGNQEAGDGEEGEPMGASSEEETNEDALAPGEGLPAAPTPAPEEQQDAMESPDVVPAGKSGESYGDKMAVRPWNHFGKTAYNSKGMTVGPYGVAAPYHNAERQAEVNRLAESAGAGIGAAERYGVPGTGRYYGYAKYVSHGYPYHGYPYHGYPYHHFRNPYFNPYMPYYG